MHLQCNQCAQHGVHEDSNKQVFLLKGTSWCQPHYAIQLELDRASSEAYMVALARSL